MLDTSPLHPIELWSFFVIAIGFFVLCGLLAYQDKKGVAFIALVAASVSGCFGYLDQISEVAATATSLTIKVREASDVLENLKRLAALTRLRGLGCFSTSRSNKNRSLTEKVFTTNGSQEVRGAEVSLRRPKRRRSRLYAQSEYKNRG